MSTVVGTPARDDGGREGTAMTTQTTHTRKRGARRSALANEDGMLLVITMVILLVVSTLAAANLINAFLERSLRPEPEHRQRRAQRGVHRRRPDGLVWLNDDVELPTIPTAANPGPHPVTRVLVPDPDP